MTQVLLKLKDEAIVSGFKSTRSADYFKILVTRYQHRLFNTAFRILGCPDEAEEIVQETFIKALRGMGQFKSGASLSAWLYAIIHNLCVDALRMRQRKDQWLYFSFDPQSTFRNVDFIRLSRHVVHQLADRLPGPDELAELAEERKAIARSINFIPAEQRIAVVLHDIEGMSYQDIATVTGVSIGTVRSRLYYGRTKLKKLLRAHRIDKNMATFKAGSKTLTTANSSSHSSEGDFYD